MTSEPATAQPPAEVLPPPTRRSVWTPREKIIRLLWGVVAVPLWKLLPLLRPSLIRLWGGRCGTGCRFARHVEITIPWHVRCGDRVTVNDRAILYGLGMITIGDDSVIDYRAHLCGGTHDMTDSRFPLLKTPITIGKRCLIGVDAYLAPDVTLGDDCRVHPRASVYKSFPDNTILAGNPGKPVEPQAPQEGAAG